MFTNKYRAKKIIALAFVIILLCIHSHKDRPERALKFSECLLNPKQYDGRELIIKNEAKTGKIFKERFEILQDDDKIMVIGATEDLRRDEYVTMRATFHKEGYLTVKDMHVHKYRRLKIAVSVLPIIFVSWVFFRKYRFNLEQMVFIER